MLNAADARKQTSIDFERVNVIEERVCSQIKAAADKGMNHAEAWAYDRFEHRWLGDIPDAVIEELERRFVDAGYKIEWQVHGMSGCIVRVIKW